MRKGKEFFFEPLVSADVREAGTRDEPLKTSDWKAVVGKRHPSDSGQNFLKLGNQDTGAGGSRKFRKGWPGHYVRKAGWPR